jgi:hypothetical protein
MGRRISLAKTREQVKKLAEEVAGRRRAAEARAALDRLKAYMVAGTRNEFFKLFTQLFCGDDNTPGLPAEEAARLAEEQTRLKSFRDMPPPSDEQLARWAEERRKRFAAAGLTDGPAAAPGGPQTAPEAADGPAAPDAATAMPGGAEGQSAGGRQLQAPVPAATAGSLPASPVPPVAPGVAAAASGPRGVSGAGAAVPGAAAATPGAGMTPEAQAAGLALWNACAGYDLGPPPVSHGWGRVFDGTAAEHPWW